MQIHPKYDDWLRVSGEKIDPEKYPIRNLNDLLSGPNGKPVKIQGLSRKKETAVVSA